MKNTKSFEQAVLRELKANDIRHCDVFVAVSGGIDSVVLLHVLSRLSRLLELKLHVLHIHHGDLKRRTVMQNFVSKLAKKYGLPFLTNTPAQNLQLKSENDLREYRWAEIRKLVARAQIASLGRFVATAHHLDDRIETQLIRLLRGTGLRGLNVSGFRTVEAVLEKIRPLKDFSRQDIEKYATASGLKWKSDPSNRSLDPLRNWLRHKWLGPLEKREPGLKSSLARSFETILSEVQGLGGNFFEEAGRSVAVVSATDLFEKDKIRLNQFLRLSREQKESTLAEYMFRRGFKNYSQSHVQELLKRLDTGRRELSFKMLRREWFINAEHIFCEPS